MKTFPDLKIELELWKKNTCVIGIDEVGRGSFAGPLVVCAVALKPLIKAADIQNLLSLGINDSKLINYKRRKLISKAIQEYILYSTVEYISVDVINEIGVGKANKLGFINAAKTVSKQSDKKDLFYLTDAFKIGTIDASLQKNIIHGDQISISIAVASIIAKVSRDEYMEKLSQQFPSFGFEKHKGYGTLTHRESLKKYGSSPHHRTAFIQNYI
jgi:ribonuclease HII